MKVSKPRWQSINENRARRHAIYAYIKENGPHTTREVWEAIGGDLNAVSSTMLSMYWYDTLERMRGQRAWIYSLGAVGPQP